MTMIWATRGRTWGHRFLLDGGLTDPLPAYEAAFPSSATERALIRHHHGKLAVRFTDPEGRRDRSGRIIVHDFIVDGNLAEQIHDLDDARRVLWPLVSAEYADLWDGQPALHADVSDPSDE